MNHTNILNVEDVDVACNSIIDTCFIKGIDNENIKKWVESNIKNYFLRSKNNLKTVKSLPTNSPQWAKENLANGKPVHVFEIQHKEREKLIHCLDFLKSLDDKSLENANRMSIQDVEVKSKEWLEKLLLNEESKQDLENTETIISFDDGWKIVKLLNKAAYRREGKLMRHCVGSYNVSSSQIYSLRNENNMPYITIEVRGTYVSQVQSKGTSQIKWGKYLVSFFEKFNLTINCSFPQYGIEFYNGKFQHISQIKPFWKNDLFEAILPMSGAGFLKHKKTENMAPFFIRAHAEYNTDDCFYSSISLTIDYLNCSNPIIEHLELDFKKSFLDMVKEKNMVLSEYSYDSLNIYRVDRKWLDIDTIIEPKIIKLGGDDFFVKRANFTYGKVIPSYKIIRDKKTIISAKPDKSGTLKFTKLYDMIVWNDFLKLLKEDNVDIQYQNLPKDFVFNKTTFEIDSKKILKEQILTQKISQLSKENNFEIKIRAKDWGIYSTSEFSFVVNKNGKISDYKVFNSDGVLKMAKCVKLIQELFYNKS